MKHSSSAHITKSEGANITKKNVAMFSLRWCTTKEFTPDTELKRQWHEGDGIEREEAGGHVRMSNKWTEGANRHRTLHLLGGTTTEVLVDMDLSQRRM